MKIYVAGHRGLVGGSLVRKLSQDKSNYIIKKNKSDLDLETPFEVHNFLKVERPDIVYLAAAKVGSIRANSEMPVDFLQKNLIMQSNVFQAAFNAGVKKLMFFGSNCMYPKNAKQPIQEESLLSGLLEKTNEAYAIAKIAGVKMCEAYNFQFSTDFRVVVPCSLYGPGDNYTDGESHVIPALIKKFHIAKVKKDPSVTIWGTGKPLREFLYVDDLVEACDHLMRMSAKEFATITGKGSKTINIGSGNEVSIGNLAEIVSEVVGFKGEILNDKTKPDGVARKFLDNTLITKTGWVPRVGLREGVEFAYMDFKKSIA